MNAHLRFSYLRLAISASLIALGSFAGVAALSALLPLDAERQVVAQADGSAAPPTPCAQQSWWHLDRNCLSRRELPWMSGNAASSTSTFERAPPAPPAPAQVLTAPTPTIAQSPPAPTAGPAPQTATRQDAAPPSAAAQNPPPQNPPAAVAAARQQSTAPAPAQQPAAMERQAAKPTVEAEGEDDTPRARPAHRPEAKARHAARAASEDEAREPAPKKNARRDRTAKPATREAARRPAGEEDADQISKEASKGTSKHVRSSTRNALNAVRRFGDSLPDVPVDAYAADGTRRRVIIRPTSIQDYYYYSVPR